MKQPAPLLPIKWDPSKKGTPRRPLDALLKRMLMEYPKDRLIVVLDSERVVVIERMATSVVVHDCEIQRFGTIQVGSHGQKGVRLVKASSSSKESSGVRQ